MSVQHKIVAPEDDGQRLDRWLKKYFPQASIILIQKTMRKGEIRVNKGRVKASTRLKTGDDIRIPPQFMGAEKPQAHKNQTISAKDRDYIRSLVIYEDEDLIALNKPAGLAVQGGTNTTRHVDRYLEGLKKKSTDPRPKLVHRLDKDTSGVLVIAKTPDSARYLMRLFKDREIAKTYVAITVPVPKMKSGQIRGAIVQSEQGGFEKMSVDDTQGKRAVTDFEVLDYLSKTAALVAFMPRSGRKHQIRVHASDVLETPILGDRKYGYDNEGLEGLKLSKGLHLHAYRLQIPLQSGSGFIAIEAPLPENFKNSCGVLGLGLDNLNALSLDRP